MPGYGLVDENSGKLVPWRWAEQRLVKAHNYWISTTRSDGRPHAMAVWGVWIRGAFYFSTGQRSQKARNLAANPHCVIHPESGAEAVIVEGTAEKVTDSRELREFVRAYKAKYKWDLSTMQGSVYYRVRPGVAFGFIEAEEQFTATATKWTF